MAREVSCQARGKGIGKSKPDRGIFMQAIILAAGIGKRLRPYTDRTPKCLVPVNGIPIIVNSLDRLAEQKVSRVVIVIGYLGNLVVDRIGHEWKGMKIEYVQNDLYATTNNIYSLWLARRFLNKNTVHLLNATSLLSQTAGFVPAGQICFPRRPGPRRLHTPLTLPESTPRCEGH